MSSTFGLRKFERRVPWTETQNRFICEFQSRKRRSSSGVDREMRMGINASEKSSYNGLASEKLLDVEAGRKIGVLDVLVSL